MNSFLIIFFIILLSFALVIFVLEQATEICEAATQENLSSGFLTKRVSNQSPRLKIEVLLVAILDMTSKKEDNKVADEIVRMRRLICAFIVTNHRRQFFSVAFQLL